MGKGGFRERRTAMYALLEPASPNQVRDAAPGPGLGAHIADGAAGTLPMVRQMSWPDLPRPKCAVQAHGHVLLVQSPNCS